MNKCFVLGYLASEVQFSFTLKKSPISVAEFNLKLLNNSLIKAYCFDEDADFSYHALKKGDYVFIEGKISTEYNVIVEHIFKAYEA